MIRQALRHRVGVAMAALALVGVMFLAVFPLRAYVDQRREHDQLAAHVAALDDANQTLAQRAAELQSTEEIERLARLHYQLVKPGEEAFVILPDGTSPTTAFAPAPAAAPSEHKGFLGALWDRISSIF
jgi:cell division protein FtsB